MLASQQTEIFLANLDDFLLTRGMFYSQKTYPGLEEFANNLDETIIGKGLITQEAWGQWECKTLPKIRETLWRELSLLREPELSKYFIRYEWPYVERYFYCQKACDFCPKKHIFECLKTWKEINGFIENLRRNDYEFTLEYHYHYLEPNSHSMSRAWIENNREVERRANERYWERAKKQRAEWLKTPEGQAHLAEIEKINNKNRKANSQPSPTNSPANSQEYSDKTDAISNNINSTESPANQSAREKDNSQDKSLSNSSPETAKILGGGMVLLFLIGIIILYKKKVK